MKKVTWFLFSFCGILLCSEHLDAQSDSSGKEVIHLKTGNISGSYNPKTDVYAYRGIPFAAPPVGDLRWKPPQPPLPWSGVRACTGFGPSPMQPKPVSFLMIGPEFVVPQEPLSEDCLYLNVWTSMNAPGAKKPVLVWIYGGGFMTGGSAAPGYSGEALAKQGIIFVSFNYRLGVFGFLAHPELTAESPQHSSGNYALLDQLAALKWVKENIAAFGGDPNQVTIAGQSAGSASVNCLLASPLTAGLISGAIGESGSLVLENPILHMRSLPEAQKDGERIAERLHAHTLKALRAIPAAEMQQNASGFFSPIVDGYVMPLSVADVYRQNKQLSVPLMTGWNGDEGFLFGIMSKENFARQAHDFGADSSLFHSYFPSATDSESVQSQIRLSVFKTIAASQYAWAIKQNEQQPRKTFLYLFNRKPPAEGEKKRFGAYHTAEIGYALHNLDRIDRAWQPEDFTLEKMMSAYWVQFVKTGDPNGDGLPRWNAFSKQDPQVMVFENSAHGGTLPAKDALDFIYARYPGNKKE